MKRETESKIMEQLKKGYQPVYYGEEGFIVISIKAYLAAAEYADAESSCFWYGDVYFEMVDLDNREDEIEAEDYGFMPRKVEFDSMSAKENEETESETKDQYVHIGEGGRVINLPYLEPAGETKAISADEIFPEVEDLDAVCLTIASKYTTLNMMLHTLCGNRSLDPKDVAVYVRIQAIVSEMERYRKILHRLATYMERRKHSEVKKE